VELVRLSEDQVALTTSALEAARTVLRADYCAIAWRAAGGAALDVIATQGISEARASLIPCVAITDPSSHATAQ
jgi:hypothetical protein